MHPPLKLGSCNPPLRFRAPTLQISMNGMAAPLEQMMEGQGYQVLTSGREKPQFTAGPSPVNVRPEWRKCFLKSQ